MLTAVDVAHGPGFAISAVTCRADHTGWSAPEFRDGYDLVLARRGHFRRKVRGLCADIDPTVAYVRMPDTEEEFAHPTGGDLCTWIHLGPELWATLVGESVPLTRSTFYVDALVDLTHRRMLTAARTACLGDVVTEQLPDLLTSLLTQMSAGPTPAHVQPRDTDGVLVAAAREAILARHPDAHALMPLAALIGTSPFRLSRAFSREMGVSLTRYRNRVRLAHALDRLELGENNLSALAADLGFADQAHLCRTARQHFGHTPTALRRLLRHGPPDSSVPPLH